MGIAGHAGEGAGARSQPNGAQHGVAPTRLHLIAEPSAPSDDGARFHGDQGAHPFRCLAHDHRGRTDLGPRGNGEAYYVLVHRQAPDERREDPAPVARRPHVRVLRVGVACPPFVQHRERAGELPDALCRELRGQIGETASWMPLPLERGVPAEFQSPGAQPGARQWVQLAGADHAGLLACVAPHHRPGEPGGEHLDCRGRDEGRCGIHAPNQLAVLVGDGNPPCPSGVPSREAEPGVQLPLQRGISGRATYHRGLRPSA